MFQENLQDAGEVIQNILIHHLSIPGAPENISLLSAAETFRPEEAMTSDLRKIALSLIRYQNSTHAMIQELNLILGEIAV
ncbi:MAG: hypothetical protein L0207_00290 [Chlamydiae bacterium]|nr:hypothetical protein [Chlamydiota bacterium]